MFELKRIRWISQLEGHDWKYLNLPLSSKCPLTTATFCKDARPENPWWIGGQSGSGMFWLWKGIVKMSVLSWNPWKILKEEKENALYLTRFFRQVYSSLPSLFFWLSTPLPPKNGPQNLVTLDLYANRAECPKRLDVMSFCDCLCPAGRPRIRRFPTASNAVVSETQPMSFCGINWKWLGAANLSWFRCASELPMVFSFGTALFVKMSTGRHLCSVRRCRKSSLMRTSNVQWSSTPTSSLAGSLVFFWFSSALGNLLKVIDCCPKRIVLLFTLGMMFLFTLCKA